MCLLGILPEQARAQTPTPSVSPAPSVEKRKLMQWGADQSTLNRKTHIVELRGNAYVFRDNEEIRADEIDIDKDTEYVKARGRVRYQLGDYYIRADSIDVDLRKKVGTVINGNISNGQFSLRGSRIDQVGDKHYHIQDYNYSTCHDCPNSWEMTGKEVDITIDGYAYMSDFVFKILDASLVWLPYMVIPVKTKRQSGLLFPRLGTNGTYGPFAVQPYYWAINDWSDVTIGAGYYSFLGARFEGEARYALTQQSKGIINLDWTKDQQVANLYYRYAIKAAITQEMPFGFEGKLRLNEVSDSGYPITYNDDIDGRLEPVLTSDLFFTRNDPQLSTVLSFKRIRNLLDFDPNDNTKFVNTFDGTTVQEYPRIVVNSNDQFIFGHKVATGVEARFDSFRRAAGPFDTFVLPNGTTVNTIREADRFTLIPNIYTTLNPWPWLSVVPSAEYRSFYYTFNTVPNNPGNGIEAYPDLARGYLLAQAEVSFQLEKSYPPNADGVSYRHTIKPTLTYSRIPTVQQPASHPFIDQIQNQARPGQYFDSSDIVPIGTTQNLDSYFTPLGNSLTYGLVTQVFRKEKAKEGEDSKVSKRFEAGLTQTLDIHEAERVVSDNALDNRVILSPLFTHFSYTEEKFSASVEYTYYSYLDRYQNAGLADLVMNPNPHSLGAGVSWTFDHQVKDGLLRFDRSLNLGYYFSKLTSRVSSLQVLSKFSINDYIMPKGDVSYNLVEGNTRVLESSAGVVFQSPSKCWQLDFDYVYTVDRGAGPTVNFALNLAGNSYGGLKK